MQLTDLTSAQRAALQHQSLVEKVETAKAVIRQAYVAHDTRELALAWTGGKDSTVLLWLVREVAQELDEPLPQIVFIDEGDVFDEIWEFADRLTQQWSFSYTVAHNADVSAQAEGLGDIIRVADLNPENQAAVAAVGYEEDTFPYQPESLVGNHLMKTVACNRWMEAHDDSVLLTGVRWDEQDARSTDDFKRRLESPAHERYEPILHFLERDIWALIHEEDIPYVSLYEEGYRSLGARSTTDAVSDIPAWKQNLEKTSERAGRQQDKEKIMSRLRDLGYM